MHSVHITKHTSHSQDACGALSQVPHRPKGLIIDIRSPPPPKNTQHSMHSKAHHKARSTAHAWDACGAVSLIFNRPKGVDHRQRIPSPPPPDSFLHTLVSMHVYACSPSVGTHSTACTAQNMHTTSHLRKACGALSLIPNRSKGVHHRQQIPPPPLRPYPPPPHTHHHHLALHAQHA